jgi:Cu+-exporting ATPase
MEHHADPVTDNNTPAIDPVCGMQVAPDSTYRYSYRDREYLFCCAGCLDKFRAQPEQYLEQASGHDSCCHAHAPAAETHESATGIYICPMCPEVRQQGPGACPSCGMALEPEAPPVPATRTEYTCPMHPEIVQDEPGLCPKCGMTLEARSVVVAERNEELIDMSRRFWVSVVLALPVFVLAMTADLVPGWLPAALSMKTVQWIEFALATPVVLWCGWPFLVRGWQSVQTWNLNMFTLIGLGVTVAWTYSVVALLLPGLFPPNMQHADGTVPVYFEAAAVITALVLLGQVLELRARSRTNAAIKLLLGLAPNTARIVRDDRRHSAGSPRRQGPGGRDRHRGPQQHR